MLGCVDQPICPGSDLRSSAEARAKRAKVATAVIFILTGGCFVLGDAEMLKKL